MSEELVFIGGVADGERAPVADGRCEMTMRSPPPLMPFHLSPNLPIDYSEMPRMQVQRYRRETIRDADGQQHYVMIADDQGDGWIRTLIQGYQGTTARERLLHDEIRQLRRMVSEAREAKRSVEAKLDYATREIEGLQAMMNSGAWAP